MTVNENSAVDVYCVDIGCYALEIEQTTISQSFEFQNKYLFPAKANFSQKIK